ncbi:MAG: glutathione synthase, partial [Betaproteobacteria bacterium]
MSQGSSILFVVDPLDALKAYKDSSVAMMRELAARGHDVWACTPAELGWLEGEVRASAHLLAVRTDDHDWYEVRESGPHPLTEFDAVLMRKDPPFDNEYLYTTYLLEAARRAGCRVVNVPRARREPNETVA